LTWFGIYKFHNSGRFFCLTLYFCFDVSESSCLYKRAYNVIYSIGKTSYSFLFHNTNYVFPCSTFYKLINSMYGLFRGAIEKKKASEGNKYMKTIDFFLMHEIEFVITLRCESYWFWSKPFDNFATYFIFIKTLYKISHADQTVTFHHTRIICTHRSSRRGHPFIRVVFSTSRLPKESPVTIRKD